MTIKGAIFDMDGTLVDSLGFWSVFWKSFGEKYFNVSNFSPDTELDRKARTTVFKGVIELIKEHYAMSESLEDLLDFGESVLYDFYRTKATVKDGVFEFLEHLTNNGVKMCLASASNMSYIKAAFEATGLGKYFETVVSCAEVGKSKDHPDVFYRAAEILGEKIEDICVFEDSLVALQTAKNAGFLTVGVFDKNNYSQDKLQAASDIYLAEGMGMDKLIPLIN